MTTNHFFSTGLQQKGIGLLRILTGGLLLYHGWEIFSPSIMKGYAGWEVLDKLLPATTTAYIGKATELITGLLLCIGWFTRIAAAIAATTLLYICFFVGQGRFWYEDQLPFVFALLCLVFFVTGSGAWSIDQFIYQHKKK